MPSRQGNNKFVKNDKAKGFGSGVVNGEKVTRKISTYLIRFVYTNFPPLSSCSLMIRVSSLFHIGDLSPAFRKEG